MASMWQKTLFYLGLVDEDETEQAAEPTPSAPSGVRTVEPPGSRSARQSVRSQGSRSPGGQTAPPVQDRSSGVAGRRVEPPNSQRRRMSGNPEHAEAGVLIHDASTPQEASTLRTTPTNADPVVIEARTFSDAQVLADHIRDSEPVVLDLRGTEPAMVRRLVDFATGLTYALDGRMAKIAQGVILVTPAGRVLGVDEQDRLAEQGLYTVSR